MFYRKYVRALLFLGFFFAPIAKADWAANTQQDLKIIYETLQENHPGYHDSLNPSFKNWLEEGYELSLKKSVSVSSFADYVYVLRFLLNGFRDVHVRLTIDNSQLPLEWPGFIITYDQNNFIVAESSVATVPCGAQLTQCDDLSPEEWLKKYSFPYVGNADLTAWWFLSAPRLSCWEGCLFIPKPQCYQFEYEDKRIVIEPMWQPMSRVLWQQKMTSLKEGRTCPLFGIEEYDENVVWVRLPSFHPETIEKQQDLKTIAQEIKKYQTANRIIFDVRGNDGGNSQWGTNILKSLYGDEYFEQQIATLHSDDYCVEWRATQANKQHMQKMLEIVTQQGVSSHIEDFIKIVIEGMADAISHEKPLYREEKTERPHTSGDILIENPVKAQVIIITDEYCASACLNFLDGLFAMGNVAHVGYPTRADTEYLEVRYAPLSVEKVDINFPIKVYRNRHRKSNQPFIPHYQWRGTRDDKDGLMAWVKTVNFKENMD